MSTIHRKTHTLLLAAGLLALGMAAPACDTIAEDERYIELPPDEPDTPDDPDQPVTIVRNVFMEEFTGQKCVNCPAGHEVIEAMMEQYGSRFVAVSVHAGGDSWSFGENIPGGLRNDESEALAARWGVGPSSSFPSAVIDGTSGILFYDQWDTQVYNARGVAPRLGVAVTPGLAADGHSLKAAVTVTNLPDGAAYTGQLHIWVVEDGIIAVQKNADGKFIEDYEHNNVFRAYFHGVDGTPLSVGALGAVVEVEAELPLKDTWVADNLSVVAFVSDDAGAVANAARTWLRPADDPVAEGDDAE